MSTASHRRPSEYSSEGENTQKKPDSIEISNEEQQEAQGHLYSVLFSDSLAWFGLIPSIFVGMIPVLVFSVFGRIIDSLSNLNPADYDASHSRFVNNAKDLLYIAVGAGIAMYFNSMIWIRLGSSLSIKIRRQLFENMMKSEVTFFDITPIGSILTLLSEDAQLVQNAFGKVKSTQISSLSMFLSGMIMAFFLNWKLSLAAFSIIPINLIYVMMFQKPITEKADLSFKHTSSAMTVAEESISYVRTVKSFNRGNVQSKLFLQHTIDGSIVEKDIGVLMTWMFNVSITLVWSMIAVIIYMGAVQISKGTITIGQLITLFGYIANGSMALIQLQSTMSSEQKAIAAGARILKLAKYQPKLPFEGGEEPDTFNGHIEFRNVTFKYPTRDELVLKNVSFTVEPGRMAALVGHSGSGKSTIVQLLERFYDVTDGMILLDGKDIKELNPRWLHRKIGLVSQEPTLFQMSIEDNIKYGADNATHEDVVEAATVANAVSFIEASENGYNTRVGEKGSTLSGGQRQRIAIARAVIKKPTILVTDEATSALDSANEKEVQIALDEVMKNRTSVVVAHRLSTIRNANIIYVFDNGEIKERGTHEELLELHQCYYSLIERQLVPDTTEQ